MWDGRAFIGFFFQAEDGIRDGRVTGVQTCALPICGDAQPLFLLPPQLYGASLPKAKALVGLPMARYRGALVVDGARIEIDDRSEERRVGKECRSRRAAYR